MNQVGLTRRSLDSNRYMKSCLVVQTDDETGIDMRQNRNRQTTKQENAGDKHIFSKDCNRQVYNVCIVLAIRNYNPETDFTQILDFQVPCPDSEFLSHS